MGAADSATAACAKAGAAAAAVLIYHSQPLATYPEEWLEEFVASIAGQTMQDYDVWELDYSGDAARNLSLVRRFGMRVPRAHIWMQKECTSHSEAINYLFSLVRKHAYKASLTSDAYAYPYSGGASLEPCEASAPRPALSFGTPFGAFRAACWFAGSLPEASY